MVRRGLALTLMLSLLPVASAAAPVFFSDRAAFNAAVTAAGGTLSSESFESSFLGAAVDFGAFTLSEIGIPSATVFDTGLSDVVTDGVTAAVILVNSNDQTGGNSALQFAFDFPIVAFGVDLTIDETQGQDMIVGGDFATSFGPLEERTPVFFGVIDLAAPFTTLSFDAGPDTSFLAADLAVWATIVPEPATLLLFGAGLAALGAWRRRQLHFE